MTPNGIGTRLIAAHDALLRLLGALSAAGLLLLPVIVAVDVVLRNVSGHSLTWQADVCEYLLFVSAMLGAPWLLHLGLHVRIDILPGLLSASAARWLERGINVLMLGVCLVLIFHGTSALINAWQFQAMLYKAVPVPVWPFPALFVGSFCLIVVELVIQIITGRAASANSQPAH